MVRSRRLELPRPFGHSDLNAARLPIPPRPHVHGMCGRHRYRPGRRASSKALRAAQCHSRRPKSGQILKELFTIRRWWRYIAAMLLLAAATIAMIQPSPPPRPGPNYHSAGRRPGSLIAEATATVRIVRGARITATSHIADARVETVNLAGSDGRLQPARLVEFE